MALNIGSFSDPEVQKCPFPFIRKLHEEAPVYHDPVSGFVVVSRYDDIAFVNMHPELFSNRTDIVLGPTSGPDAEQVRCLYAREHGFERFHTLVTNDPPDHTRYRAIVDKVFTPSFVKGLESYISALVDEIIDGFIGAGEVDLLDEFCIRLPMYVISDHLGVSRSDWRKIKRWSDVNISLINPSLLIEERLALCEEQIGLQKYLASVRMKYLAEPGESYFSRLAHAEVEGDQLTEAQFVNVAEQLLVAGNETTTNGIAHGVVCALRQPELLNEIKSEPLLIANYVEEILRLHAPSPHLYRKAVEDSELGSVKIKKGEIVLLSYLAGNYDPSRYENPERIDLKRTGVKNHLAFGRGIHFCVGNQLARSEMRISLARLFARLQNLRFSPNFEEPGIAPIYHVHAVDSLHVRFDP